MTVEEFYKANPGMEEKIERAWEIYGNYYEGKQVTPEQAKEYKTILQEIIDKHTPPNGYLPFGIAIWMMYATKYLIPLNPL